MRPLALLAGLLVLIPAVGLMAPKRAHDTPQSTVVASATPTPGRAAAVTSASPTRELAANHDWSYQIDDATLSRGANAWADEQLAMHTPLGDVRLRNLVATLRDNQLVIGGDASGGWITQPLRLTATATAARGRVLVRIRQLTIGPTDVPMTTQQQVEAQVQQQLDNLLAGRRVMVDSVQIANGSLSMSGTQL